MRLLSIFLILSLILYDVLGQAPQGSQNVRRGGSMTLYPAPRIGRSQLGKTWLVNPDELEYFHNIKRQGLIPFPRVGRSKPANDKYSRMDAYNDGIWYVPRTGLMNRRIFDNYKDMPVITYRDESPRLDFTPRLGRENQDQEDEQFEQPEAPHPI